MGALPYKNNRDRSISDVFASNFAHHILWIIAVNEVIVVKSAERLRRENPLQSGPMVYESVYFITIIVKRRDEYVSLRWWGRERSKERVTANSIEVAHR